jgi:hypothetical protein
LTASGAWLYSTTLAGGDANGDGTVFSLTVPAQPATANVTADNTALSKKTFGPPTSEAPVLPGAIYAALASYVSGDSLNGSYSLGTTATIAAGNNGSVSTAASVSFAWRTRSPNEANLASDVLNLTGLNAPSGGNTADPYLLTMTSSGDASSYYLATILPNGTWENATKANAGFSALSAPITEPLSDFLTPAVAANLASYLGDWGYDTSTGVAWAILDYQSDLSDGAYAFAVEPAVVPEPGTIVLLLAGGLCLAPALRRRLRKA